MPFFGKILRKTGPYMKIYSGFSDTEKRAVSEYPYTKNHTFHFQFRITNSPMKKSVYTLFIVAVLSFSIPPGVSAQADSLVYQRDMRASRIYYNNAMTFYYLGDTVQALTMLDRSIGFDSLFVPAHEQRQDMYISMNRIDTLISVYTAYAQQYPDSPEFKYLSLRLADEDEQLLDAYRELVTADSLFYWGYIGMGRYLMDTGYYDEAMEEFKKAIAINPGIPDAQYSLGLTYAAMGDTASAIKQLEKTQFINRKTVPEANLYLGLIYLDRGDTLRTLEYFDRFLQTVKAGPEFEYASSEIDSINAAILEARRLAEEEAKARERERKKKGRKGLR